MFSLVMSYFPSLFFVALSGAFPDSPQAKYWGTRHISYHIPPGRLGKHIVIRLFAFLVDLLLFVAVHVSGRDAFDAGIRFHHMLCFDSLALHSTQLIPLWPVLRGIFSFALQFGFMAPLWQSKSLHPCVCRPCRSHSESLLSPDASKPVWTALPAPCSCKSLGSTLWRGE